MRFEQVRLLCMFDLPFDTAKEQKEYRVFRKHLIENGFTMLQYSIYYRSLPNRSSLAKYESILKKKIPSNGNVRLIYVTESQFKSMVLLVGERSMQEEVVGANRLVVI
ncbi:CRISPR-associated endonuclease Cas2 [Vaginisenegalia massiliensis]|uniref:CRISPR-associated endonuclease Cas2 n=1 Tax=Vaginisenegalia massiliensis TaxID=2058294 RepID=UPI001F151DBD|nr:CRISPR-associated endonuclease Cas2 [Vaginisenegalia massiliensis]